MLKQVRTHLIETARLVMETMAQEIARIRATSLRLGISTVTGQEVILFTPAESPLVRDSKKK